MSAKNSSNVPVLVALAQLPSLAAANGLFTEAALPWFIFALKFIVVTVIVTVFIYTIRHLVFTLNRLFSHQRHPYLDVDTAAWPMVTVVIPAHNEEDVIGTAIDSLLNVDYPPEKYEILIVNDRSNDKTGEIVDQFVERAPNLVSAFHRTGGIPGKASALAEASERIGSEVMIVFDADYIPGRGLIKQLVAPFFDAEIGAVMGRVVPHNAGTNLLTRLLDLERAAGYQVDQQARMNLHLVPQYGGSVGGVRMSALREVGGWHANAYAEDTDLTYRLLLHGFKTAYENRCECYEEVPEIWQERNRQIMRWAKGHNQVAMRYTLRTILSRRVKFVERIDAILLLGVYLIAPLLILGFIAASLLYMLGESVFGNAAFALVGFVAFGTLGQC
ncbi:MAG: glycosyltransferase family 2 protein [Pseudomonadota bacterium]